MHGFSNTSVKPGAGDRPVSLLKRFASEDPTAFAASQPGYDSRYLPTTADIDFLRTELLLPSGSLLIVRRPPIFYEGAVATNRGLITFLLDDAPRAKVNGRHMTDHRIAAWKKGTSYRGHDEFPLTICSFLISETSAAKNWLSQTEGYFSAGASRASTLRLLVRDILAIAEHDPLRLTHPNALKGADQSIVGGIGDTLLDAATVRSGTTLGRHVLICKRAQEYLSEGMQHMYSTTEVANACGVGARTLYNAFMSVLGVSPNKYLLLRRLWMARQALLRSSDQELVKSIALDYGFWHLGRFALAYQSRFGELPSSTLARRRSR